MTTPTDYMGKLRELHRAGRRVEIDLHSSSSSASFAVAGEDARAASAANARGRVARIIGEDGEVEYECDVSLQEARELIGLGAVEV